jgi:hypothetical protein
VIRAFWVQLGCNKIFSVLSEAIATSHESQGQRKVRYDSSWLFLRTRYFFAPRLVFRFRCHNPKVGGSNPPATKKFLAFVHEPCSHPN